MSVEKTITLPHLSLPGKKTRLPRKQKKELKKFIAINEAIVKEAEMSIANFGGYIEDIIELDEMRAFITDL